MNGVSIRTVRIDLDEDKFVCKILIDCVIQIEYSYKILNFIFEH